MTEMNAAQMIRAIEWIEVGVPQAAPDCIRIMRGERFALAAALRSGRAAQIDAAMKEAVRVARMWGLDLVGA